MSSFVIKPALVAALLIVVPLAGAHAVGDRECKDYATAAVRQVHQMHEYRRCDRGQGARWSEDWNIHYQWCRESSFEAIGAERDARTNWLRACEKR